MKKDYNLDDWEGLEDTPQEFEDAIQNATSANEKDFFKKLMYKIVHEPAFSNDVLMNDKDNEEGIYIYFALVTILLSGARMTLAKK